MQSAIFSEYLTVDNAVHGETDTTDDHKLHWDITSCTETPLAALCVH